MSCTDHRRFLHTAARLALRGHGGAAPNPMVGCVIVSPAGEIVGWGYHRQCGDAHAERIALDRAGHRAHGATVYVTLEPCDHTGRTDPCTEALIDTGVAKVVIGRADPHPDAGGGAQRLRDAGIEVEFVDDHFAARAVSEPFVHRVQTSLPWVIAKWAQTLDGRIATRSGESKWISSSVSRRMVHRERGRVDCILTGIGTVLADDPLLTARNVRVRRMARRVVVDPHLQISPEFKLIQTARETPTTVVCTAKSRSGRPQEVQSLIDAGVEVIGFQSDGRDELPLEPLLRELVSRHEITTVLTECGPGLLGRLFKQNLVNLAWVFIASRVLGDEKALPAVTGLDAETLAAGQRLHLRTHRRRGDDLIALYEVIK